MLFVLPGMGADSGMFTGSWRHLSDAVFIDWPSYQGEQTLTGIAGRIVALYDIPHDAVVIGTSLGGMVACEIAKLRRLRRLFLIGSAVHPSEINTLLTTLRPLAKYAPVDLLQILATSAPGELARMFTRTDPEFIRATLQAIFTWGGIDPAQSPPLRIHGKQDRVIPLPYDADLILNGGHLIAMTHATECCDFILKNLNNAPAPSVRHP
jgi:pimeloyl-ACP methyl ester carboxylesterase